MGKDAWRNDKGKEVMNAQKLQINVMRDFAQNV